jgi:hypothetical protein
MLPKARAVSIDKNDRNLFIPQFCLFLNQGSLPKIGSSPKWHSKKPYNAFFLGLAGLSSWARFKTNVAFFQAAHSENCVDKKSKNNEALTPCWHHYRLIEMGLVDCSEIYEKTSKNL